MKLSPTQQRAVDLMKDGYELGYSSGYFDSVWLQKGGCRRGGHSEKITFPTFHALINKGLVEELPNQNPWTKPLRYKLTQKP